jgi:cyanoexosortase A
MKATSLIKVKSLQNSKLWLLGIGAATSAIILTLTWKSGDVAQAGMSILFLLAVASLLGEKQQKLNLESGLFPSLVGGLLLATLLWQSTTFKSNDSLEIFVRVSPFLGGLAISLLASGFQGFKQYWQELTILFFLGIPKLVLSSLFDLSPLTAKFSAFLLWYFGFDVSLQGVFINLPTGSVKVYAACSGIESICYLLGIAVICLFVFPMERKQIPIVSIVAIALAFIINGIRISLLAVMSANRNLQAFNYWHEGDGSLLFGIIQVIVFVCFYLFLLWQQERKNQNSPQVKK